MNVVSVELPPLRERGDDISILLQHFLEQFSEENGFDAPILEDDALNVLQHYRWPGNVRELRNFCENLVVLKRAKIGKYDLDPRFTIGEDETDSPILKQWQTLYLLKRMKNDSYVTHFLKQRVIKLRPLS